MSPSRSGAEFSQLGAGTVFSDRIKEKVCERRKISNITVKLEPTRSQSHIYDRMYTTQTISVPNAVLSHTACLICLSPPLHPHNGNHKTCLLGSGRAARTSGTQTTFYAATLTIERATLFQRVFKRF